MKVLTFSTLYPNAARPVHGIFVETRLRQLIASGQVEAQVVAPVPWFPWRHRLFGRYATYASAPRREVRHGIKILHPRYPVIPKFGMAVAPLLLAAATWRTIARLAQREPIALIDAHYFYPDGVAAAIFARKLNIPLVLTARGSDINLIAQHWLAKQMIRWAACKAAAVIAVSKALKDALIALGVPQESVHVLRNGVDLHLFSPPADRQCLRVRLGMKRTTLLSVGNLLDFKGHDIAIRALSVIPECDLIIIGAGPERTALDRLVREQRLNERVRFLPPMMQEDLRDYYGAADALVLASSREGWPNVLLEAMACGTPVVANDVGGSADMVNSVDAGRLLKQRTPEGLAAAVKELLSRDSDRGATRRHATNFDWASTTTGQLELFEAATRAQSSLNARARKPRR